MLNAEAGQLRFGVAEGYGGAATAAVLALPSPPRGGREVTIAAASAAAYAGASSATVSTLQEQNLNSGMLPLG